ncbi:MAG: ATP-dependent DNA helicase PcrA [Phycisphaerales bacterium]|nr:MAG: ATP-dependent DNA helicase PcrA [Phycisphaerales bacterium]
MSHGRTQFVDSLLEGLTEAQAAAVRHVEGPLLVLAGAGSGKTRVITRRAAHLACAAARPWEVLAITFTNKAAQEMRERIAALGAPAGILACTFHSFCARTLRIHHDIAGLDANFTIFDRDDRRRVIRQAVEACELSTTNYSPARLDAVIGRAKNALQGPDEFERLSDGFYHRAMARIYRAYEGLLARYQALDFDDLLMRTARLLGENEAFRASLEARHRFVLIDEYQDTNAAQYEIARHLTRTHRNICATGDPDQSIYGWRGADIGNILSFERDYPDAAVVRLEQNYRSTKRILAVADALIRTNVQRKAKALWTENPEGPAVRVIEVESGDQEAAHVAEDILRLVADGASRRDMAVFYRTNAQSRSLEEAFLARGIAYVVARGLEFYARKEIKDVIAYLNAIINPADEVSLLRIINTPARGIGATTIDRLRHQADRLGVRLFDVVTGGAGSLDDVGRSAAKVTEFGALLCGFRQELDLPPHELIDRVVSLSGLRAMYRAEATPDRDPSANIDELISGAREFERHHPGCRLIDWLEHTSLLTDVDGLRDDDAVTLMTLHSAKGLEFPVVYVTGLEEGVLPMRRGDEEGETEADIEEERRLCFVGFTRAKGQLTLTWARYRLLRGVATRRVRSRFLDEVPADLLEWEGVRPDGRPRRAEPHQEGRLPDDVEEWTIGTIVEHPTCGLGRIVSFLRGGRRTHVEVAFQDGRRRSWVLEFSDLKRVDYYDVG